MTSPSFLCISYALFIQILANPEMNNLHFNFTISKTSDPITNSSTNFTISPSSELTTLPSSMTPVTKRPVRQFEERIVGGVEAEHGLDGNEFPSQISILRKGQHICGGSIYNESVIITAAHCLKGIDAYDLGHDYSILAGAHFSKINSNPPGTYQVQAISRVKVHPCFEEPVSFNHDLALVFLENPLILSKEWAKPIRLQREAETLQDEEELKVIGWGKLKESSRKASEVLMKVTVRAGDQEECNREYSDMSGVEGSITDGMVCASAHGKDACGGDSGGPLIGYREVVSGCLQRFIAGVVSFGEGCARKEFPGVYTNLYIYTCWIQDVTWPKDCSEIPDCTEEQRDRDPIDENDCEERNKPSKKAKRDKNIGNKLRYINNWPILMALLNMRIS